MGYGLALGIGSLVTSGALAVPPLVDAYDDLTQWSNKRRDEINSMSNEEFKRFRPTFFDKKFLGIDGSKAKTLRDEAIKTDAFNEPELRDKKGLIEKHGGTFIYQPGFTAPDAIAANSSAYLDALEQQRTSNALAAANAGHESKPQKYLRDIKRKELFESRRFNTETLLAQERGRLDTLDFQRSRDRRDDMRYNEGLDRLDRKDRRAAISSATAGLAALAAAFAI